MKISSSGNVSRTDEGLEWNSDRPALIEYEKTEEKETLKVDSRGQSLISLENLPIEVNK